MCFRVLCECMLSNKMDETICYKFWVENKIKCSMHLNCTLDEAHRRCRDISTGKDIEVLKKLNLELEKLPRISLYGLAHAILGSFGHETCGSEIGSDIAKF